MSWVSTGSSLIHLDLVVLLLVPHMAAARPCALQSCSVDLHTSTSTVKIVFVSGNRVPFGHSDLFQCSSGVHCSTNCPYVEVLLLGGESSGEEWNNS